MSDLLPVLVADLVEESARDFLEECARENEEAWVPLVSAPVDTSRHLLEVYTPTSSEPLRLLAEPLGPPTEHGFPLRLSLLSDDMAESLRVPSVEHVAVGLAVTIADSSDPAVPEPARRRPSTAAGTARRPTPLHLSDAHSADLAGAPPPNSQQVRDALIGRSLAGGKLQI